MTVHELITDFRGFCNANTNEDNVKKYSRYFKGEFHAYGVGKPLMEAKIKELVHEKDVTLDLILEAAPPLIAAEKYEEASFAMLLTDEFDKQFSRDVFDHIGLWFSVGIHNWAHADLLGMLILPKFMAKEIVGIEDFNPWLSAENPFQRRTVAVTLIKHIKKHHEAIVPLFAFLEPLMSDPIREVHQGIGWYLREAWKINPEATELFLLKWKETAPRLIFQYACEKMTKEKKESFRRSQK